MVKKILSSISAIVLLLLSATSLTACNSPAKMEKIVGTYELVTDTITKYEQESIDRIETYQKEAYLVLTGEESGFYAYKDKDTSPYAIEIKIEYFKNDNDQVSSIRYVTGSGEKPNSLNVDAKDDVALVSRWPSANKLMDAYEIKYKKISDSVNLSEVKNAFGNLPVFAYGLFAYNCLYSAEIGNQLGNYSEYIYKFIDLDSANQKATIYYALKSDRMPVVKTDVNVVFVKDTEKESVIRIKIGEDEYELSTGLPRKNITLYVDGTLCETYEELCFRYDLVGSVDYEAYFREIIAEYEKSLAEKES